MTAEELRTEIEEELRWRQEEIAFLKNQLVNIEDELRKERFRKTMVLTLYSHFEGFVKMSLQTYAQFINDQSLLCNDSCNQLVASTLNKTFKDYENNQRKSKQFKDKRVQDSKIHRYYRRVDFLDNLEDYKSRTVSLDDDLIDTESNLWSIVLKKNLYYLGLPIDLFEDKSEEIDRLVNRRNGIAHGTSKSGVKEDEYTKWEDSAYRIMSDIIIALYDYAVHKKYLKYEVS